ncbi:mandelate racemase/muconate lactonizing enzyme family protein [Chloroflexi bacterium TSY]|nr:mandelate racemase/muconate lactonizing enzyme family protein [Chloroflexi bacterium TSY]
MSPQPISGSFTHLLEGISREPLQITDVKTTRLTYQPTDGSYVHECGPVVLTKYDVAIVEVFTDQGLVGIGPGNVNDTSDYSYLLGQNPFDVELLGLPAGFDVACWDIIGKAKGMPVYQLLATDHEPDPRVHVYASGGVLWTYYDKGDGRPYGVEALIEEALRYQAMGFDTFKWRPGTDWAEAGINPVLLGEICRQLREAVGSDFQLGLEKKGYDSWTFEECLEIAPIINDLNFLFFEQPMGDEGPAQFADYLQLKERMPKVMLWGGERFRSLTQARPWLQQGIYDAVQSDASIIGLTENWYLGRVAAFHGVKLVPHNWSSSLGTMCNVHLVAGVPNGHMCEFFLYPNPFRDALFQEPYRPVDGYITLSDKPGFGMELAPDLEKQFPYVPGPNVVANPRFPHAWARAQDREKQVRMRYERIH